MGGSKSTQELCEKRTEVRRAEKGPEAPFMLFLAGAQTSSYLYMLRVGHASMESALGEAQEWNIKGHFIEA